MESRNGETDHSVFEGEEWEKGDHVFILSTSGKPVYSRHGTEDRLATLSGVMQALVSFVQSSNDAIKRIVAGNTTIEFLVVEPITIVSVVRNTECCSTFSRNLSHLHNLLLSILTSSQLQKVYKERKNFDLRRLLAGSERLIDYMIDSLPFEPGFFLSALPVFPLDNRTRSNIANTLSQCCSKMNEVVFGLLLMDGKVVFIVRMGRFKLDPLDSLLILNLVASSESFKSGQHWAPLCLPQFDSSGFLHAYVSYLSDDCPACLILLTVNKEIFIQLRDAKQALVERIRRNGALETLCTARTAKLPTVGIPQLRHFLYVMTDSASYFWPPFAPPYEDPIEKEKIISAYRHVYDRASSENAKVLYVRREKECIFFWSNVAVQLFLVLEPFVRAEEVSDIKTKILNYLSTHADLYIREDFLF